MNDNHVSTELEQIVQKMISAGEPEVNIAAAIKQYNAKEPEPEVTEPVEGDPKKEEESRPRVAPVTGDTKPTVSNMDNATIKRRTEEYNALYSSDSFNVDPTKKEEFINSDMSVEELRGKGYIEKSYDKTTDSLKDYGASLALGFAEFTSNLGSYWEGAQLGAYELIAPGELTRDEKIAKLAAVKAVGFANPMVPSSLTYAPLIDELESLIPEYKNETLTEDIKDGNYAQAAKRTVEGALRSAPSLVAAATGVGGLVVLGASSAGGKFEEEFEKDPSTNTGNLLLNATATGTTEALFELVTRGLLKKAGILAGGGKTKEAIKFLEGGAAELVKGLGGSILAEGGSEAATELTMALIDAIPKTVSIGGVEVPTGVGLGQELNWDKLKYQLSDAAVIGSFVGGNISGIGIANNTLTGETETQRQERTKHESSLMHEGIKDQVINSALKINKLAEDLVNATPEGKEAINKQIEQERNNIIKLRKKNSVLLNNIKGKDLKTYAKNVEDINKAKQLHQDAQTESEKAIAQETYSRLNEENAAIIKRAADKELSKNISKIRSISKNIYGDDLEIKEFTKEEAEAFINDDPNITDKSKESLAAEALLSQGFFHTVGKDGQEYLVINKDVASETYATNVAGHEFLHKALDATFQNNPDIQVAVGEALKSTLESMDATQVSTSEFVDRLKAYKDKTKGMQSEEVLTVLSDSLQSGDLKFDETIFTKIGDVIRRALQDIGIKGVRFDTGRDVYNFIKDYNKAVAKGKVRGSIKKAAVEGVKGNLVDGAGDVRSTKSETKLSKSLKESTRKIVAKNEEIYQRVVDDAKAKGVKVSKDLVTQEMKDELVENNLARATALSNKAARVARNLTLDDDLKIDNASDWLQEYSLKLAELANTWDPSKNDSFGAYMNQLLPKKYSGILEALKSDLETSSMDSNEATRARAEAIAVEDDVAPRSDTRRKKTNVLKIGNVERKAVDIKKAVEVNEGDTFKEVSDLTNINGNTAKVGEIIFDVPGKKILDRNEEGESISANLTYAKKIVNGIPEASEAGNIQSFYNQPQTIDKLLKILPPENVSSSDADINEIGENIDVDRDVLGRGLGLNNKVLNYFYDKTNKRSQGLKSQPFIWKLKPEFKNPTPKVIQQFQADLGITPRGELNNYNRDIGQLLKGVAKFQAQQTALSTAQRILTERKAPKKQIASVTAAQSKTAFSVNISEIGKFMRQNLALDDARVRDMLLVKNKLAPTLKITKSEDIEAYTDMLKRDVFPLLPYEAWFGPRGGTILTTSKAFNLSSKDPLWAEIQAAVKALDKGPNDKSIKYGAPIDGVNVSEMWSLRNKYTPLFSTPEKARENIKNGEIAKFNEQVGLIHEALWKRISKSIKKNKNSASGIATYLGLTANDTGHWHKMGAQFAGFSTELTKRKKDKKGRDQKIRVEYEHAMPATQAYLYLLNAAINHNESFDYTYGKIIENYKLIALDKAMDDKLRDARTKSGKSLMTNMTDGWNPETGFWWERYFNDIAYMQDGGIDPSSIEGLDGRTFAEILNINAQGIDPALAFLQGIGKKSKDSKTMSKAFKASKSGRKKLIDGLAGSDIDTAVSGINPDGYSDIRFSKSHRAEYEKRLLKKNADIGTAKEAAAHIDALFNWVDSSEVPAKKKSKFEKLALHYMVNNKLRMPEDGYKVIEAERLAEAKKIDPFSFKNPNDIIEKYSGEVTKKNPNPDQHLKENDNIGAFSNKREIGNGITVYDVKNGYPGMFATRNMVNEHFGKKSNPWCIVQAVDGEITPTAKEYWDQYGTKQILFKDGKLLAMRTESKEGPLTDAGDIEFWSRENIKFNEVPGNNYVDKQGREVRSSFDEKTGKDSGIVYGATKGSVESGKVEIYNTYTKDGNYSPHSTLGTKLKEGVKPQLYLEQVERYNKDGQLHGTQEQHASPVEMETGDYASSTILTKKYKNGDFIGSRTDYGDGQGLSSFQEKLRTFTDMEGDPVHVMFSKSSKGITVLDFDDTLATTKSGVKARIPNPDGTPKPGRKVIFMAGGAGSGKGNVISKLGLKEAGYKIVNSDVSLEWLKKNHGLPENQTDYTAEQRSQLSKLSAEARKIAKRKQGKFAGNGDGVVVDGTGGSVKAMGKLVQEFKDKGYDVSMVFVETSLEVAQQRNAARSERSLREGILNKNHKQVQGNKDAFKDMFKGNFNEVSTDNIGINDDLPIAFKNGVDKFTSSYENRRLDAEEFARDGAEIKEMGGEFDFSEFDKVVDGKTAPLFEKAMKLSGKFGTDNMFILTARSPNSAIAIKEFLDAQGLKIPLKNITGLGQSEASAKANWIAEKVGEGYNDFYFADDAIQNVEAVKDMLDQFDVKGKVQQAKIKFSKTAPKKMSEIINQGAVDLDSDLNIILEETKNVDRRKRFSPAKARKRGKNKGRFKFFVPPSADDFAGLLYAFMGKGKQGEQHHGFFKKNLFDPFSKGIRSLNQVKQNVSSDITQLRKAMPDVKKKLSKKIAGTEYTYEDAIRVNAWEAAGFDIPGLSNADKKALIEAIENDAQLKAFAQGFKSISDTPGEVVEPGSDWLGGTINSDLSEILEKARATHLQQWIDNKDIIFNEANLNKIEAVYGAKFREALEDSLWRMEHGGTKSRGKDRLLNNWMTWMHGSVGATMFFNARSAILQQLSNVNFLNWHDNNPIKAAKAFANQKQYWADFVMIFNSPWLKQRRGGIATDVNATELLSAMKDSKNPTKTAIAYLLRLGFTPTQIGDSLAIATGGSTMYRNRVNTHMEQGLSKAEAEVKAFEDMMEIAEETQQSTREDKISQQQASPLGKVILAFQNTTMQYNRIMKKAALDLTNGRGDPKTHISKIIYYGTIQSMIFYGLQQALFASMFSDDDDDQLTEDKKVKLANGMLDSLLRGSGIHGAVIATVKNVIMKFMKEKEKMDDDEFYTDMNEANIIVEALNISPPIGIKARKMHNALKTWHYNDDVIRYMDKTDIDNPMWEGMFNITEAVTNAPTHRLYNKTMNIRESLNADNETWKRIAIFMGWSRWTFGIRNQDVIDARGEVKVIKAKEKKDEASKAFIKDQDKERGKGQKNIKCAAATRSGNRCGKKVLSGGNYCTIHESAPTREDGKQAQCSHIKSDGKRCKMKTSSKSGKCYYHD